MDNDIDPRSVEVKDARAEVEWKAVQKEKVKKK